MKKLLVAASVAAGLAVGAVPAFAQSTTTANQGWGQAQNYNEAQNYSFAPRYSQAPGAVSADAHIGDGSRSGYMTEQHELQMSPGYSPDGTN
jgi:hypothetical protein